ncbi:MAG: hypothetical protein U1F42_02025 [Candidatus Competibacteraceae bacterium]
MNAEIQPDRRIARPRRDPDNRLDLAFGAICSRRNSLIQSPPPAWRISALRQPSTCTLMVFGHSKPAAGTLAV